MTVTRQPGITTYYRGIEYRSRLEARWAAMFTRLDWSFTYEPFDGHGYIPDFLIDGDRPMLVEIKPAVGIAEYQAPIQKAADGLGGVWAHDILILGATPLPHLNHSFVHCNPAAGLLGEAVTEGGDTTWEFDAAVWATCGDCAATAVFHEVMTYACRPCGHYDGDHYLGAIARATLEQRWAEACNDVKWRGRAA